MIAKIYFTLQILHIVKSGDHASHKKDIILLDSNRRIFPLSRLTLIFTTTFFVIAVSNNTAKAQPEDKKFRIESIIIDGLTKTEPGVILTELGFAENEEITVYDIEEGIKRIKNTNLFINVSYNLADAAGGKNLTVYAEDRWTTIPIAKFSSGGGVSQLILGIYDANLLGKYLELGAQYERLGETNSAVAWFRKRRLFGSYLSLDLQAWNINRLRTKYLPDAIDPEIKAGFLHTRQKLYLGFQYEFKLLKAGVLFEHHDDKFSDKYVSDEVKRERIDPTLPPSTEFFFYGLNLAVGQINHDSYLVDGTSMTAEYRHGISASDTARDFDQLDITILYYKTLPYKITFAERLLGGATNTETLQYWYYLGGLDRIRGFSDNRFAGRYMWLSNTELRVPSYRSGSFVLQNVLFYDVIATGEQSTELKKPKGASIGTGLRFIAPKIYRFVARFDYSQQVLRRDDRNITFGVQQFF